MPEVTLESSDGVLLRINAKVARQSQTIADAIDACGTQKIPLKNVTHVVLKQVVEYLTHHQRGPNWRRNFFKTNERGMLELIRAANYLAIESLIEQCASVIGSIFQGNSPKDTRFALRIANDLSAEQEEELSWIKRPTLHEDALLAYAKAASKVFLILLPSVLLPVWLLDWSLQSAYIIGTVAAIVWHKSSQNPFTQSSTPFPLLALDDDLILPVLKSLGMQDRLCARINQRLYDLELNGRYKLRVLAIGPDEVDMLARFNGRAAIPLSEIACLVLDRPCSLLLHVLRNFRTTTTFEYIRFECTEEYRELIPVFKEVRGATLVVYMSEVIGREEITDDTIESWYGVGHHPRDQIMINGGGAALTGAGLHRAYERICSGQTLRRLQVNVNNTAGRQLLHLLGICYRDGDDDMSQHKVLSTIRNAKFVYNSTCWIVLIDGRYEIRISWVAMGYDDYHGPSFVLIERLAQPVNETLRYAGHERHIVEYV